MLNLVFGLLDGTGYLLGILLSLICLVFHKLGGSHKKLVFARLVCVFGVVLVVISATPIPYWLYAVWLIVIISFLIGMNSRFWPVVNVVLTTKLILLSVLMVIIEVPHHLMPSYSLDKNTKVFVIGDSISAGVGDKTRLWPSYLAEMTGLQVGNLALAGANAKTALKQVDNIPVGESNVVILEIGGNDLMGETSDAEYVENMERLLQAIRGKTQNVIFIEAPWYTFRNNFGKQQRLIAKRYNLVMVPKSVMINAIRKGSNTIDGLHLSEDGHRFMAETISKILHVR